jgi:hypothetical protein
VIRFEDPEAISVTFFDTKIYTEKDPLDTLCFPVKHQPEVFFCCFKQYPQQIITWKNDEH